MAKRERLSRLNPAYLAARHGGVVFLCLSVCTAAGLIWALLGVPVMYRSEAAKTFVVHPAGAVDDIDWNRKLDDWRGLFLNAENQPLVNANLRFRAKLALTLNQQWPDSFLTDELAQFEPMRIYAPLSQRLWGIASRFGLVSEDSAVNLTRRDLAANLDFQSLAKIVSDLDPPHDAPSWDFTFFRNPGTDTPADYLVTRPGPEDRFFRVFYHLHELLYPGYPAESPSEAWRTAVEELTARLDREAGFAGGGGFGPQARRELARELQAIPALLANSLYSVPFELYGGYASGDVWPAFWREGLDLQLRPNRAGGAVDVDMTLSFSPLRRRRDPLFGRLPALSTALAMDMLEAEEKRLASGVAQLPVPAAPPTPTPAPAPEPVQPAPEPEAQVVDPEPQPVPSVDTAALDAEDAADRERIRLQEDRIRLAALDRSAAEQRLEAFRDGNDGLVQETVAARQRADRMRERYEDAKLVAEEAKPALPLAAVKLMLARDEILENLTLLLQSCTEEHPMVRQARRELAAVDELLAGMNLDALRAREMESSETRLRNMYLEWDGAENAWSALEQRRRRRAAEGDALLAELQLMERELSEAEAELARMRESLLARAAAREALRATAARPPEPVRRRVEPAVVETPPPVVAPTPAPTPVVASVPSQPVIDFDPTPAFIPVVRKQPPWEWVVAGALAGLCLGCLILLLREMLATRFRNVYQARRLVNMPLLAALPAYSPKSFREAAKTLQGEVGGKGDRLSFVPLAVDFVEPPPATRRGIIKRSRAKTRVWPWLLGLLALALAGLVYYQSLRMRTYDASELAGASVSPTVADYQAWRGVGPGRARGE